MENTGVVLMINCRFKNDPIGGMHVHDDPGYVADALRCQANGWTVWVDNKCHVEGPYTMGDTPVHFNTIIDYVRRS